MRTIVLAFAFALAATAAHAQAQGYTDGQNIYSGSVPGATGGWIMPIDPGTPVAPTVTYGDVNYGSGTGYVGAVQSLLNEGNLGTTITPGH